MRDLEIRGTGNVLGPEQSGHMMSVGYDLYLKLLEEAVQEEKGETPKPRVDCAAELLISPIFPLIMLRMRDSVSICTAVSRSSARTSSAVICSMS
ncbi:MAG: hypothetical protein ACLRVN_00770 [Butyricicoccus sp.]